MKLNNTITQFNGTKRTGTVTDAAGIVHLILPGSFRSMAKYLSGDTRKRSNAPLRFSVGLRPHSQSESRNPNTETTGSQLRVKCDNWKRKLLKAIAAMKMQVVCLTFAVCLCLSNPLGAYEWPLDVRAIHEAWELGQRNDQQTGNFLAQYLEKISGGDNNPYTAEIQIVTPYAQVVDQSRQKTTSYSEAQAALDYHQRGNTILINVVIMLPAAYPTTGKDSRTTNPPKENSSVVRPENFWQNFKFNVKQNGKIIPSLSIRKKSISSSATKGAPAALDGANVSLEFDAKDVASDETVVEVITPDAKTVSATFDLKKLR